MTIASIIVAGTRTPSPDSVMGKIYKAVEFLSLTIGKAKDTGTQVSEPAPKKD